MGQSVVQGQIKLGEEGHHGTTHQFIIITHSYESLISNIGLCNSVKVLKM